VTPGGDVALAAVDLLCVVPAPPRAGTVSAAPTGSRICRDFTAGASKLNARWYGDVTHVGTWEGWLYLATVIDIASRRVLGYALAYHLRTELVSDALANAAAARTAAPV